NTRVFWRLFWQAAAKLDATGQQVFEDLDGNVVTETDARYISNLSISYNFGHLFPGADDDTDMIVQLSIDNLFDRKPDLIQQAAEHFTFVELLGRRYTLGVRATF